MYGECFYMEGWTICFTACTNNNLIMYPLSICYVSVRVTMIILINNCHAIGNKTKIANSLHVSKQEVGKYYVVVDNC